MSDGIRLLPLMIKYQKLVYELSIRIDCQNVFIMYSYYGPHGRRLREYKRLFNVEVAVRGDWYNALEEAISEALHRINNENYDYIDE